MKARYRYRFYPTVGQQQKLAQLFGCVRVVWNDALALCKQSQKLPSNGELQKRCITQAKKLEGRSWLKDVSVVPLQQSVADLGVAYKNFFDSLKGKRKGRKVNLPKFKKRTSRQSARLTQRGFRVKNNGKVYLAKIGDVKPIWSRELPAIPSSVTIIKDCEGRYFLSFVVEINPQQRPNNNKSIGVDLGITDFATTSNGEKYKAPKPLKRRLKRLRKLQRNLARKTKGSRRREKAKKRVAKLHAKVKDTRADFLHKLSTKIIRENQTIVLEDLNVSGMVKNRKLSRAISDLGWRDFRTMLETKSVMYGREFKVISRWEPTSQTCSCCGFRGGKKELGIREWTCLNCGAVHDRDINAAINILVAGGQSETQSAFPIGGNLRGVAPLNGRGGRHKTTTVAATCETSTQLEPVQLSLFG
ncbi:transposase [Lusitaniella coriacea LEGE 07157]|uniref:Transposase n=1 Tax=Lusitaniella coriacea LEGE 07157 TaxID=945747 RepID=A0A8J7E1I6_9CYAN|nr:RNA-guided endonuclease TnpB family protein [Lusitaniella coriacea]MBE9118542.1 transposase [Lusitaniella coriacea LEGE 07157]